MTDSPAGPAPHKVTLYRNGSVYTAADPFATAMLVDGDTVAWVGSEQAATSIADASMEIVDLRGALLAPGFVDSHTHLVFAGDRAGEFVARATGARYDGGGIGVTVAATRAATDDELRSSLAGRVVEAGSVVEVMDSPKEEYTKRLLANSPRID